MRNGCVLSSGSRTLYPSSLTFYVLRVYVLLQPRRPLGMVAVALIEAGESELTELVTYHILGEVHRDVAAAVVHADGVAHHVRRDGAVARPGLDKALLVPGVHLADLFFQVRIYVRSPFCSTRHS